MTLWDQAEPVARRKAYRTIDNDPMVLLEGDGGPGGIKAEVYMARLFGYEEEIVADGMRLRRPEPVILMPLHRRQSLLTDETEPLLPSLRAATYVMQSGFAVVTLAAEYAPADVTLQDDFTFRVLYLRYRRRD